jgi:hypothetical protein
MSVMPTPLELVQEHASELAKRYRHAKPGDVGILLRTPRAGFEALNLVDLTFIFDSPDVIADILAPRVAADGQRVVDDVRAGATLPGRVPVVVVSDGRVDLLMVLQSALESAAP